MRLSILAASDSITLDMRPQHMSQAWDPAARECRSFSGDDQADESRKICTVTSTLRGPREFLRSKRSKVRLVT